MLMFEKKELQICLFRGVLCVVFGFVFVFCVVWVGLVFVFVWGGECTGHHIDNEGLPLLSLAALTFVTASYASINFQQVTACVTTWRKPQRRWSKKKRRRSRR